MELWRASIQRKFIQKMSRQLVKDVACAGHSNRKQNRQLSPFSTGAVEHYRQQQWHQSTGTMANKHSFMRRFFLFKMFAFFWWREKDLRLSIAANVFDSDRFLSSRLSNARPATAGGFLFSPFFSLIPPTDFLTWCHAHNSTRLCTQTQEQNELFSSRCAGSFVRLLKEAPPTPTTVVNALEKDSSRLECGGKIVFNNLFAWMVWMEGRKNRRM